MIRRLAVIGGVILVVAAALVWRGFLDFTHPPRSKPASSPSVLGDLFSSAGADSPVVFPPGVSVNFVDVTASAGIEFHHDAARTDMDYIMETMGAGVGWLDYDQDGLMDLIFIQSSKALPPYSSNPSPTCKLFKNLGHGKFRDVTALVGLGYIGCGQGVAIGDIDNDGFPDIFVTCFGKHNVLYHNVPDGRGGRRFQDITAAAGLADHPDWKTRPNYSTSAAFLDYNNDGFLDLFVCSYVKVDVAHYPDCWNNQRTKRISCGPRNFEGTRCLLYRNNGNGTFTEVGHDAGIDQPNAKALGVVALDLDDDGLTDLFVTNDTAPNFLFRNLGNGRFESLGPASGCSVNLEGMAQAYMGVDADDLNGDGRPDLFATAFSRETNTFFRNEGRGLFLDITAHTGLGPPSWFMLGFGTCFLDVVRDGNLDIAVANGHVYRNVDDDGDPQITFRQKAQLFLNNGMGQFRDISSQAGKYFLVPHVGRGLAYADYDNDGHLDLAFANNDEAGVLLHNESQNPNHWIRLELQGTHSNRDAIGTKVIVTIGDRKLVRYRKGGGSYLSANDPRLLIGIGLATKVDDVEIRWPRGALEHVGPLTADRGYLIIEGQQQAKPRP